MRVVVGVDTLDGFPRALNLVARLRISGMSIDLVHVVESVLPDGGFPDVAADHPLARIIREKEAEGQDALAAASAQCAEHKIPARTFLRHGDPARELIQHADRERAELIAVYSTRKGYYGSLFFGSVSKGLVIGANQSLLIVKGDVAPTGSLTAVIATDHSDYANRCLRLLNEFSPSGIEKATILTTHVPDLLQPDHLAEELALMNAQVGRDFCGWIRECSTSIFMGSTSEGISKTVKDFAADLLIMGAQGRGFFERIRIGSNSFHQVVNEPHSVLILRVPRGQMEDTEDRADASLFA